MTQILWRGKGGRVGGYDELQMKFCPKQKSLFVFHTDLRWGRPPIGGRAGQSSPQGYEQPTAPPCPV